MDLDIEMDDAVDAVQIPYNEPLDIIPAEEQVCEAFFPLFTSCRPVLTKTLSCRNPAKWTKHTMARQKIPSRMRTN